MTPAETQALMERTWKALDRVQFRYASKRSDGVKHGVNISDVKRIFRQFLSEQEKAVRVKVLEDTRSFRDKKLLAFHFAPDSSKLDKVKPYYSWNDLLVMFDQKIEEAKK